MKTNPNDVASHGYEGLTKREHFASMAMQGMLSDTNNCGHFETIANDSVKYADALIAALNKEETK